LVGKKNTIVVHNDKLTPFAKIENKTLTQFLFNLFYN